MSSEGDSEPFSINLLTKIYQ